MTNRAADELGGEVTHSRLKNIIQWAFKRIKTMEVIHSELEDHLKNPNNSAGGHQRATAAPGPGYQNDGSGTRQGNEGTASRSGFNRKFAFKNKSHEYDPYQPDHNYGQTGHNPNYQQDYGHDSRYPGVHRHD
jgi:hypothetical protein